MMVHPRIMLQWKMTGVPSNCYAVLQVRSLSSAIQENSSLPHLQSAAQRHKAPAALCLFYFMGLQIRLNEWEVMKQLIAKRLFLCSKNFKR